VFAHAAGYAGDPAHVELLRCPLALPDAADLRVPQGANPTTVARSAAEATAEQPPRRDRKSR